MLATKKRSFGETLRALRIEAGLPQEELASRANVSQESISAWERGVRQPGHKMVVRLAKALGVPIGELSTDEE